jgi:mannose/cellobiose epimerase-like protein (N-acyl-D-glucosamine 2-epimerase family)
MKTTLDLADPLFHAAKALAAQQKTTLRALVEEGLRLVMEQRKKGAATAFKLRDARFDGGQAVWPDAQEWRDLETAHLVDAMRLNIFQPSRIP